MGCVLLSNLMKSCLESLNPTFPNIDVYYWSDSADCSYWINPGSSNPADIPRRGIDICMDKFLELWLSSPNSLFILKVCGHKITLCVTVQT